MELVDAENTICSRCGTEYDWQNQEMPEDAAYYWVPKCPDCHAKMTANPTTKSWLHIVSKNMDSNSDNYSERIDQLNAYTRLYHGRMSNASVDELIKIAKWFDRQSKTGTAYGPRFYRDIAFSIRKQAREQF